MNNDNLSTVDDDDIREIWDAAQPAAESEPLPAGEYLADIVSGKLERSRSKGTLGFKLTFRVVAPGEFRGRRIWRVLWLTKPAMIYTQRDLAKIKILDRDQMKRPLTEVFRCKVQLTVQLDLRGTPRNEVLWFNVIGPVEPERDGFTSASNRAADPAAVQPDTVQSPVTAPSTAKKPKKRQVIRRVTKSPPTGDGPRTEAT